MILGRLVRLLDAGAYALIPPRWLTKFFVLGDVLSFCTQGGGAFTPPLSPFAVMTLLIHGPADIGQY